MMFKDIIIGQYFSAKSPVHSLDARIKIILTIAYIALLFAIDGIMSYIIFSVFTAALVLVSKIPVRLIIKGLKPMIWILFITAIINLFAVPGEIIISIPIVRFILTITREGIFTAAAISARLLLLMIGASLLTLTTPPIMLTDGIEYIIKPLNKIKVPTQEIAMMMSISIRFIPTIAEEADKIRRAQLARGANFDNGGIIKRSRAMLSLLIPLFVSAFRRADDLATAMDARCYRSGYRTRLREMKITRSDIFSAAVFIMCAAILLTAEFVIEF